MPILNSFPNSLESNDNYLYSNNKKCKVEKQTSIKLMTKDSNVSSLPLT